MGLKLLALGITVKHYYIAERTIQEEAGPVFFKSTADRSSPGMDDILILLRKNVCGESLIKTGVF